MKFIFDYARKRLTEKTTKAAIVAAILGLVVKYTGASEGMVEPIEEIIGALFLLAVAAIPSEKMGAKKLQSHVGVGLAAIAMLFLTGCGAAGMNKQQYAGLNYVCIETGPGCAEGATEGRCRVTMVDGKEKASVSVKVILADGTTYEYTAGDVAAFEGQATRADVDKAAVKAVKDTIKEVVEAVKPKIP